MLRMIACAIPILALSSMTTAQDQTVALTSTTQFLISQVMDGQSCRAARCGLSFEKAAAPNAGGTAYDARSSIVWVTNGLQLAAFVAPGGTAACKQACATVKLEQPVSTVRSYCTGLAFLETGERTTTGFGPYGRLYALYSNNYIGVANVKGCTVFDWKFCRIDNSIGAGNITGGLACDDLNRQLIVGTFTAANGAVAYVFKADDPCSVICKFQLGVNRNVCGANTTPLRGLTGLAINGCSKMLYATDGNQTIFGLFAISTTGQCAFTHRGCCSGPLAATDPYTGLALLPPPQSNLGRPCSSRSCNACLPQISTTGDAVLGNPLFRINLANAPSNTTIYALAIGIGACSNPGVNLGFCQPVLLSLSPPGPFVFIFSTATTGGTCNRSASVPLGLAPNPAGCGLELSFQWVMGCRGVPNGDALTDCLTVKLTSI